MRTTSTSDFVSHLKFLFAYSQHLGLTLCGVTARLVENLVQGHAASIDLEPYDVGRFQARILES